MYSWNLEKERLEAESYLSGTRADFVTTYMTVANLQYIISQQPDIVTGKTVDTLLDVLEGQEHAGQRQAYFLYKKAADALAAIIENTLDPRLAKHARDGLFYALCHRKEKPYRAAAEALGGLPLTVCGSGPGIHGTAAKDADLPVVSWRSLLESAGLAERSIQMEWRGRSLILCSSHQSRVLVIKTARINDDYALLHSESLWMEFLSENQSVFPWSDIFFQVPEPIRIGGSFLFRVENLPASDSPIFRCDDSGPGVSAMGFFAPPEYFCYPNEPASGSLPAEAVFHEIIARNAGLLGRLTASGIIHTAPIPLFHNRVQRHRRSDQGLYQWPRGGRLDQWLNSCRFPNIGKTGIRDFEHFTLFDGPSRRLYEFIGSHILSLVLIAGSYFRNRDTRRKGLDASGQPVDARDLFDAALFKKTVTAIFENYYQGFTGKAFMEVFPLDLDGLTNRLIEEMGVDRHMEEILRIAEQNAMTEAEFSDFLTGRGFSGETVSLMKKGEKDIPILTGPHLGGFNQRISVPELIEFTAAAAALCISDRYCHEKSIGLKIIATPE